MQTAIFTVTDPTQDNFQVTQYKLDYTSVSELKALFKEAREVWSEFIVTVDGPDNFKLSAPITWHEEFMMTTYK